MEKSFKFLIILFSCFFIMTSCQSKTTNIQLGYITKISYQDKSIHKKKVVTTDSLIIIMASNDKYALSQSIENQYLLYFLNKKNGKKLKKIELQKGYNYINIEVFDNNLFIVGLNNKNIKISRINFKNFDISDSVIYSFKKYTGAIFNNGFLYLYSNNFDNLLKIKQINLNHINQINKSFKIIEEKYIINDIFTIEEKEGKLNIIYQSIINPLEFDINKKLIYLEYSENKRKETELYSIYGTCGFSEVKIINNKIYFGYYIYKNHQNHQIAIIKLENNLTPIKLFELKEEDKNFMIFRFKFFLDRNDNILSLITKSYTKSKIELYGHSDSFLIYKSIKKKSYSSINLGSYYTDIYDFLNIVQNDILIVGDSGLDIAEENIFKRLGRKSKKIYSEKLMHINIFKINDYKNLFEEGK